MITVTCKDYTEEYSLKNDKENPTVFILGMIPSTCMIGLSNIENTEKLNEYIIAIARLGIKGWKNLRDKSGNELEYKSDKSFVLGYQKECLTEDLINILPIRVINELASQIIKLNDLTKEEEKN